MTRDELISLLNSDLRNERMHLNFYLYHASAVVGLHAHEYREFLIEAAKGELEHVLAFQDRILGLGGIVWPGANEFSRLERVEDVLSYAAAIEQEVVDNYTKRIAQLDHGRGALPAAAYMQIFYEDQLQDSYEDGERIRRILAGV
jgi:bacterioferritin (cytochrome b1)